MQTYFFKLKRIHHRTEEIIGTTVGFVQALSLEQAEEKAWQLAGSDSAFGLEVMDITKEMQAEGFAYTVYKSVM